MQEFSFMAITVPYPPVMQTGRPAKQPRTPFGERLHAAREAAGLSQAQVAEKMGVAQNAYAMWERRAVALKPQQIEKLAALLKVSVEYFFDQTSAKKPRGSGPAGRLRLVFEEASKLPRHQQGKVAEFVQGFLNLHRNGVNDH
jgi:HTH-type transcriptional regulator, cell division transcriptional repressor